VAVYSRERDVDPVGACVGMKGTRVQAIIRELRGEKIDIVEWSEDPVAFVTNALSPAKVQRVSIVEEREKEMEVVVEDKQLSLAIGKKGQNVRLAAKLTGWRIDIKSEEEKRREVEAQFPDLEGVSEGGSEGEPQEVQIEAGAEEAGAEGDAQQADVEAAESEPSDTAVEGAEGGSVAEAAAAASEDAGLAAVEGGEAPEAEPSRDSQ
jgi:N utilization substance protein A